MEHFSREISPHKDLHLAHEERPHHEPDAEHLDSCHQCGVMPGAPEIIYGPDDRLDLYQVTNQCILDLAADTVLVANAQDLIQQSDGTYTLSTITLQQKVTSKMKPYGVPLCSDQKFASQPTGGFCTGFFITPSCIMTAGHCIVDTSNQLLVPLSELRFITGFKMTSQTNAITNFKTSQIFTGVQLIRSQSGSSDFAIVQVSCLDGKTQGVPLPISPLRSAYLKESVFAIGYPTGLPTKLAPNAVVQNTGSATTFLTNLDVFRANSGSPVCDVTNTVVGILVNGPKAQDYVPDPKQGCKVLNTFSSPDIPGTIGVQRITGVVGPVYDLSLQLNIGKEGLRGDVFGGRQILLRLKNGVPPLSIPHGSLDAYTSYTFPLNPTLLGIDRIDAIDFVEINSPGLDRPWTDVWSLDRVLLYVNGEQLLYNFDDKAGDNKWVEDVTPLPDNYISGNTLLCYGSTPKGSTNWQQYNHNSLYVDINTSAAHFSATPQYFTSLGGDSKQWQVRGVNAIYYPTPTGFRIYIQYLEGDITPAQANAMNWYVNWTGYLQLKEGVSTMNLYGGSTPKGSTNWQQYTHNSLCVEINTSAANFSTTPQYFASLGGDSKQWQTQGVSAIYYPTSTKFSIYIQYLEGDITPAQANAMNWYVNWMGIESY